MKMTKELIEMIRAKAEELHLKDEYGFSGVCVRVQDIPFELGSIDHVSHVWIDGEDTGEELPGISAIGIDDLEASAKYEGEYPGEHVAIVCGDCVAYGQDAYERILADAHVEFVVC